MFPIVIAHQNSIQTIPILETKSMLHVKEVRGSEEESGSIAGMNQMNLHSMERILLICIGPSINAFKTEMLTASPEGGNIRAVRIIEHMAHWQSCTVSLCNTWGTDAEA